LDPITQTGNIRLIHTVFLLQLDPEQTIKSEEEEEIEARATLLEQSQAERQGSTSKSAAQGGTDSEQPGVGDLHISVPISTSSGIIASPPVNEPTQINSPVPGQSVSEGEPSPIKAKIRLNSESESESLFDGTSDINLFTEEDLLEAQESIAQESIRSSKTVVVPNESETPTADPNVGFPGEDAQVEEDEPSLPQGAILTLFQSLFLTYFNYPLMD